MTEEAPEPPRFLGGRLDLHQNNALKVLGLGALMLMVGTWSDDPRHGQAFFSLIVAAFLQASLGRRDPDAAWVKVGTWVFAVVQLAAVGALVALTEWQDWRQAVLLVGGLPLALLGIGTMLRFNLGWYEYAG